MSMLKSTRPLVITALLSALAGYGLHALAEGAPTVKPLFYSGTLEANGKLATGPHAIVLTLFDAESAGKQLCSSETLDAPVDDGHFRVEVSADCVKQMQTTPDVWVALKFTGGDGVPHELSKRTKVGAVPYALEAQHAVIASSANAASGVLADTLTAARQDITAAQGAIAAVVGSSAVSVTAATPVPVAHATFVNLPFSTEEWDLLNEYDAQAGFKAKNAGVYQVCGSVYWGVNLTSELDVFVDGGRLRAFCSSSNSMCGGCVDVRVSAGQRVQVSAYQTSGTSQSVVVTSLWSYLNIHRVY